MSHTEQELFFRWVLATGANVATLRASLDDDGRTLLAGDRHRHDGRCVDVDFAWESRRQRPLVGLEEAMFHGSASVEAIWIRARSGFAYGSPLGEDEDDDVDGINQIDRDCDRIAIDRWRPCRYGFDEVCIVGASTRLPEFVADALDVQRWRGAGSYLARNCSAALIARFEPQPGPALARAEPIDALALADTSFARIEWRWRGRVVHAVTRGSGGVIQHEAADGWDNVVDDVYLERFGDPALRRPAELYARDRFPPDVLDDDDA